MATMIIEGERTRAASGKTYEVRNPATGEVVDEVPAGGAADVDKAAQAAAKAFPSWSKLAPAKRAEILHKAARHMLGKVEEIAHILTKEQGKTLLESRIEALIEGGLPEGVVNVVLGAATGEAIVDHPLIRKIALTGSTPTGKKVMARAAEGLKKITLELGGSDPCIVLDDADLEAAARAI